MMKQTITCKGCNITRPFYEKDKITRDETITRDEERDEVRFVPVKSIFGNCWKKKRMMFTFLDVYEEKLRSVHVVCPHCYAIQHLLLSVPVSSTLARSKFIKKVKY